MCKLGRFRPVASVSRSPHSPRVRGGRPGVLPFACTACTARTPALVLAALPHPHVFVLFGAGHIGPTARPLDVIEPVNLVFS